MAASVLLLVCLLVVAPMAYNSWRKGDRVAAAVIFVTPFACIGLSARRGRADELKSRLGLDDGDRSWEGSSQSRIGLAEPAGEMVVQVPLVVADPGDVAVGA